MIIGNGIAGVTAAGHVHRRHHYVANSMFAVANSCEAIWKELGIEIVMGAKTESLQGDRRVQQVTFKDSRTLDCDLFLVAACIRAETGLAKEIGLDVALGLVVDEQMRTRDPLIFAAGDVAEYNNKTLGLWTV